MDSTSQRTPDLFTSVEVVNYAKITYRQLDYWNRVGIIRAEQEAHGSGSVRMFTLEQARKARAVRRMVEVGLSLQMAAALAALNPGRHALGNGITLLIEPLPGDDDMPVRITHGNEVRKMLAGIHQREGGEHDGPSALQSGTAQGRHDTRGQDTR